MKRTRRTMQDDTNLGLTSMIDVTFLLLIFFLCTLQFRHLERKIELSLPRDGAGHGLETSDALEITIVVVETGEVANGTGRRLVYRAAAQRLADLEALELRLDALFAAAPELDVRIRVGPGIFTGEVVSVLDLVAEVGFSEVVFATAPAECR